MTDIQTTEAGVPFLRTPEDRFADLADFPYEPSYVEVDGFRMGYVDVGPSDGPAVLLLHGEPTWGYLYRRMIPPLVAAGFRCVAPDLIGFGRSDKPTDRSAYTYAAHVAWVHEFLDRIELPAATMFAQDWGGLIGLRVATDRPDRFDRVVIGNTGLPIGESLGDGFDMWLNMSQTMEFMDAGALLQQSTQSRELTDAEMDAYRAPFPSEEYMAGRAHESSRAWCRSPPTMAASPRTRPRGRCSTRGRSRSSRCGAPVTSSSVASASSSSIACPAPRASRTRRSSRVATSCRTTGARMSSRR